MNRWLKCQYWIKLLWGVFGSSAVPRSKANLINCVLSIDNQSNVCQYADKFYLFRWTCVFVDTHHRIIEFGAAWAQTFIFVQMNEIKIGKQNRKRFTPIKCNLFKEPNEIWFAFAWEVLIQKSVECTSWFLLKWLPISAWLEQALWNHTSHVQEKVIDKPTRIPNINRICLCLALRAGFQKQNATLKLIFTKSKFINRYLCFNVRVLSFASIPDW